MNATSAAVVIDYQLVSAFERERQKLLAPEFAESLGKPLAHWALPADRHLPLALVGRTIESLIRTPFDQLYATPGVGPKKIASLIRLLARVTQRLPSPAASPAKRAEAVVSDVGDRSATAISEVVWAQWRSCIRRHGLERESLGRLARSLQDLPRAVWNTPLEHYLGLTLEQFRALRGHGEKRVTAVLEVFENLHGILLQVDSNPHLAVRFQPRFVQQLEPWVRHELECSAPPSQEEVRAGFVAPLLALSRADGGELLADVVNSRLSNFSTVQGLARQKGLTRGRLYELWGDAAAIVSIRWPEGRRLVAQLAAKLAASDMDAAARRLFDSAFELWFPAVDREDDALAAPVGSRPGLSRQDSKRWPVQPLARQTVRLNYSPGFNSNGVTSPSEST